MSFVTIGILGILGMLVLLALGVHIGFSLAVVGIAGYILVSGPSAAFSQLALIAYDKGTDFIMICVPLFILMGNIVLYAGLATDMFECFQAWLGRLPGGLAIASVFSCGAFGAVTGSSAACVATMGAIIMPQLKKYKYDDKLSSGCMASAGTLAIMIPPSLGFIFYGIMTDVSIADLFIAGIFPGIVLVFLFSAWVFIVALVKPQMAPLGPCFSWKDRFRATKNIGPVMILFFFVIGGLYMGAFTPTEGAAMGVVGALAISLIMRRLTWENFKKACHDTGIISAMIFVILIGGYMIARFLALTHITESLVRNIGSMHMTPAMFILLITLVYLVMGMLLDVFGMLVLSIPFVFPVAMSLGIDPIWLGVYVVLMTEIGLVTPPIGTNVFILKSIVPEIPMSVMFRGIFPFVVAELGMVGLLVIFPQLATWLPYLGKQ
jgi:C4-dicarboxylate transporter, DctM subunit